jgi:magnesium-transporting ATPase (P-type)
MKGKKSADKNIWHAMNINDVLNELQSDMENGLSEKEANQRIEDYGPNEIPKGQTRSWWKRLLLQFHNVLIYVLMAAAIITSLMEHWIDTWVIVAVILINALIGFILEGKAEKALEGIRNMLSLESVTIHNGKKHTVEAEKLVPGDIVLLKSGDKIPADIRLIQTKDFRVEESPLTGESTAVEKDIPLKLRKMPLLETRHRWLFPVR